MSYTIGIDARFYGEAGPGRYVKNIIDELQNLDKTNTYYIFLRKSGYNLFTAQSANFIKVDAEYKWYTWQEQLGFLMKLLSYKLDLLYVPHFNVPILYPKKLVTAIPDLIMHTYSTEKGTTLPKPYFKFKKIMYKLVVQLTVQKSKKIIVPSYDVKNDFQKVFTHQLDSKYVVAYEGVDKVFYSNNNNQAQKLLEDFNIKRPYILYISSMYAHKNVPRLLEAYKILRDKYNVDYDLILIGKKDKFSQEIGQLVNSLNLKEYVHLPGLLKKVSDEETIVLRQHALCYVFPSLKEGFSLTPLEAQVLGLPCVISNIPVHKEVYGDSVIYFDPYNTLDIAEKIHNVTDSDSVRDDLVEKGYSNIKKYDWVQTAKTTLQVFYDVLGDKE
jgi:glycosyltransferase involved in cell wall biosynthesis